MSDDQVNDKNNADRDNKLDALFADKEMFHLTFTEITVVMAGLDKQMDHLSAQAGKFIGRELEQLNESEKAAAGIVARSIIAAQDVRLQLIDGGQRMLNRAGVKIERDHSAKADNIAVLKEAGLLN